MIIITQSGLNCIFSDHVENVYIGSDGLSIKVNLASGKGCEAGRYVDKKRALYALQSFYLAVEADDASFTFPGDREAAEKMEVQRSHSSHVTSMKVSHGGS